MKFMHTFSICLGFFVLACINTDAFSGDLTPPGPPGSTMHTLEQIYGAVQSNDTAINQSSVANTAGQSAISTQIDAIAALISTLDATAQTLLLHQLAANASLEAVLEGQEQLQMSVDGISVEADPRTPIRASDLPLVIDEPGSYCLVENATGSGGT